MDINLYFHLCFQLIVLLHCFWLEIITNETTETNFTKLSLPFSQCPKANLLAPGNQTWLFSCRVKSAFGSKSAVCRLIQYSCLSMLCMQFATLYCLRSIVTYFKVTVTCDKLKLFCFNMKGIQWDELLKSAVAIIESRARLTAVIDLEVFVGKLTSVRWDFRLAFVSYSSNLRIKYFFVLCHHLYFSYHKLQFYKSRMKASL